MVPYDIKILVIAPYYNWFIKNLVDAESKFVSEINVLAHHNYLTEISKYLPFGGYFEVVRKFYTKEKMIDLERKPDNVNVHLSSMLYLIPDGRNKRVSDKIAEKFESYIKKHGIGFDIIHAHFIYPQGDVAIKLGRKFNIPVIITAHGHDVYDMPYRDDIWNKKIKWILDKSDNIITVSESNRKILVNKLKIREKKVTILPNGFDSQKFNITPKKEAREKLKLSEDKKILLNVANLYPIKGQEYLVKAMKIVVEKRRDILCVILGSGIIKRKLERLITKFNLEQYVKLLGSKPHQEIPLWMNAADLFILPSLNEGNPTVMFEALGVGLPFIGTAVGGVPEIITSENYGMQVEPANQKDLAEKILIALEKKWDKNGIATYAKRYTWENIAQQTVNVYKTLLYSNNRVNR